MKLKLSNLPKPFLIAEIGVNHECDLELAKEMILSAKNSGASAVKFQSYKADSLAIKDSPAYWNLNSEPTTTQHALFSKYDKFGVNEFKFLSKFCEQNKIIFMSTPFDIDSVNYLDELMPIYKIASADITNDILLKAVAKKNKPIILSTGCSTKDEIESAIKVIHQNGDCEIALLHCILNYPTSDKDANLSMILDLKKSFPDHVIGYSDHTLPTDGMLTCLAAYSMGADIIEKHYTHTKDKAGNDHYHSMDPCDLAILKRGVDKINLLRGSEIKKPIDGEFRSIEFARRSLVSGRKITKGSRISEGDLVAKRPGNGITPNLIESIVGRIANQDIEEGVQISYSMLSSEV